MRQNEHLLVENLVNMFETHQMFVLNVKQFGRTSEGQHEPGSESPGSGAALPVKSGPLLLLLCDLGPVIRHLCPGVLISTTGVVIVLFPGES